MATHATMHVEVVTAERELYSGEANELVAPGTEGELGILHGRWTETYTRSDLVRGSNAYCSGNQRRKSES